jgi:hypothetical protein
LKIIIVEEPKTDQRINFSSLKYFFELKKKKKKTITNSMISWKIFFSQSLSKLIVTYQMIFQKHTEIYQKIKSNNRKFDRNYLIISLAYLLYLSLMFHLVISLNENQIDSLKKDEAPDMYIHIHFF